MKKRTLKDKVIVITGGSSGIGAATAVRCANLGMNVTLAARHRDKLEEAADRVETFGRKALIVECDVTHDDDVQHLFAKSHEHFGRTDAFFANAGYGLFRSVMDMPLEECRQIFETNLYGTLRTIQTGVPYLRKTEDGLKHALICSSSASEIGIPTFGAYCATKAAQDSFAGAMRAELHEEGIAVTSVHPIGTYTNFNDVASEHTGKEVDMNTPSWMMHSTERVAGSISKALLRPKPEVWPSTSTRWLLALGTAVPRFPAWLMRKHLAKIEQS